MKILVTGGTGFTGSHLVKRLLAKDHEVLVIDYQKGLFFEELRGLGAKIELGGILDRDLVDRMSKGCEVIHHLAAAFRELDVPDQHYWNVNVEGTRNLLEAASRYGVRKFIYCSTQGVHGDIKSPPGNEQSTIAPEDYYQYTKYEGERVLLEHVQKGVDAVIIRPTAIYGPGDPGRFLMLYRMAQRGSFLMFGDGKTFYHPVYIDNLVDAFELAAEKHGLQGQAYIIGDECYYSLNELVKEVGMSIDTLVEIRHLPFRPLRLAAHLCEIACKPFKVAPPLFRRRVDWFKQNRAFDISKSRRELGYIPKVDLRSGLRQTGDWYKAQGYLSHTPGRYSLGPATQ
ncbi:MAG: NAD(P)-dependent oxidoreductase [Caldilineaceae bacterium]|nr:NAD(P)-dependent oxidoreductase [Caldilineaceae bacterium]